MQKQNLIKIIFLSFIVSFYYCGQDVKEADDNYKNAIVYYSKINKQPDKKEDALYFFLLSAKSEKYNNVKTAKCIYNLAADVLKNKPDITLDDKFRLNDNILFAIEILIEKSENLQDSSNKEIITEAQNIVSSFDEPYVTIRNVVKEKSTDDFNKLRSLALIK